MGSGRRSRASRRAGLVGSHKIAVRDTANNRGTEGTSHGNVFVHIEIGPFVIGGEPPCEHRMFPCWTRAPLSRRHPLADRTSCPDEGMGGVAEDLIRLAVVPPRGRAVAVACDTRSAAGPSSDGVSPGAVHRDAGDPPAVRRVVAQRRQGPALKIPPGRSSRWGLMPGKAGGISRNIWCRAAPSATGHAVRRREHGSRNAPRGPIAGGTGDEPGRKKSRPPNPPAADAWITTGSRVRMASPRA